MFVIMYTSNTFHILSYHYLNYIVSYIHLYLDYETRADIYW